MPALVRTRRGLNIVTSVALVGSLCFVSLLGRDVFVPLFYVYYSTLFSDGWVGQPYEHKKIVIWTGGCLFLLLSGDLVRGVRLGLLLTILGLAAIWVPVIETVVITEDHIGTVASTFPFLFCWFLKVFFAWPRRRPEWKLVTADQMNLVEYSCGVKAGDRLRLKRDLHVTMYSGEPTGEVHPAGRVSTVLAGNPDEPDVVWLRWEGGERHTWDTDSLLEWFERVEG